MALYHRRDRPPSECASAIAATSPRDRRLVLAHYAVADLARQLLFIPSDRDDDFSPEVFSADAPDRALLREGWRKLLPRAIADPLNPHSWRGGRGHGVSALEMPQAPRSPAGTRLMRRILPPVALSGAARVWATIAGSGSTPPARLSTRKRGRWRSCSTASSGPSMPVWSPLAALTREGRLPPAVYLLIDAIDNQRRGVELPCHRDFWLAVQEELLPLVHGYAPFSDRPDRTVAAGQSFGGLAAMFAALNWPQRFGCVLSQSGSYWWPHRDGRGTGFIGEQLRQGEVSAAGLRVWLEAGQREPIIFRANQALLAQLITTQQTIFWRQVDGGHDALCWRGGLTAGLIQLWQPLLSHP